MRTFIRHTATGEILSVCRTEFVSPQMATPFGDVGPGEAVLEVTDSKALAELKPEEIHESYEVSLGSGRLITKR